MLHLFPANVNDKFMNDLKFLTLLRTLDDKELSAFNKYLKQAHGNEQIALSLFAYILKFYPGLRDEKKLDLDYAYRKVFKKELGEERKNALNTLSDLHTWLKHFMLSEKATKAPLESQALWLSILWERGLEAEFARLFARLQTETDALSKMSATDYMRDMIVNHFKCYYSTGDKLDRDGELIRQYEDALDMFYVVTKFKIACEKANRRNVLSLPLEPEVTLAHIDFSEIPAYEQQPLLLLYREVYQLVALHREDSYDRIEAMLPEYAEKVAPAELHRIVSYLYNYASSQTRKDRNEFWEKMHWLNKFGVEHAVFVREGGMSVTQFNNIVSIACNMRDVDWASWFIKSQSHFLPEHLREEATILADATISFEKKEYDKILKALEGREFKELLDKIRSRAMILRTNYELGDKDDRLWDSCTVFEAFLRRHEREKIEAVVAALNFTGILKMLAWRTVDKDKIISDIESKQPLYFKPWLLEKANDYIKLD